jgi:moderate conductance mechanosensitive channel
LDTDVRGFLADLAPKIAWSLLIAGVAIFLLKSTFLSSRIKRHIINRNPEERGVDAVRRSATIGSVVFRIVQAGIVIVAVFLILDTLGFDTTAIVASAGIAGIAIGFAAQSLIRDFLNGALIVVEDQYRVGEVVTIAGVTGVVEDIDLRLTKVRDLDGQLHLVPNGEVRVATNLSRDYGGINLDIPVPYDADLVRVVEAIDAVGREMAADPLWGPRIKVAPQFLRVEDFQESAMLLKILGQSIPSNQWEVTGELRRRLKQAFDAAGMEMPLPQRVIRTMKNEESFGTD